MRKQSVCLNRMANSTCSKFFIVLVVHFCFTFFRERARVCVCASSPGLSFPFFPPFVLWFLWDFRLILKSLVSWFNAKNQIVMLHSIYRYKTYAIRLSFGTNKWNEPANEQTNERTIEWISEQMQTIKCRAWIIFKNKRARMIFAVAAAATKNAYTTKAGLFYKQRNQSHTHLYSRAHTQFYAYTWLVCARVSWEFDVYMPKNFAYTHTHISMGCCCCLCLCFCRWFSFLFPFFYSLRTDLLICV